jgi:hypothetical protein
VIALSNCARYSERVVADWMRQALSSPRIMIRECHHGRVADLDLEGEDVESTLAFSAAAWAIAMALGPVLQIRRILDQRARAASLSLAYFIVLLIGFGLWVAYGIVATIWPGSCPTPWRRSSWWQRSRWRSDIGSRELPPLSSRKPRADGLNEMRSTCRAI